MYDEQCNCQLTVIGLALFLVVGTPETANETLSVNGHVYGQFFLLGVNNRQLCASSGKL